VTLEPCGHHGKTPPCADAVVAAGVRRVVAAARDPNPQAAGGVERLRAAGLAVDVGLEEAAARELNAPFFHAFAADRPWVWLKLAVSLDGAIADAARSRGWLTGEEARREVHRLRAGADAIAVGIGTVLADDPSLTVRDAPPPRMPPLRVVFDRGARLPPTSALARTAREVPTLVVADAPPAERAAALRAAGVELLDARDAAGALRALKARGVRSVLVEGGARLAGALLGASLVDRMIIFQAPVVLGAGALNAFAAAPPAAVADAPRWRPTERQTFGDDVMTTYARTAQMPGAAECSRG
jgi:diaminohydroxyphosphoribosylaminopyrimidine deaminase/5-amino-6-(5-phosphoribosylamino)uracil reductase